MRATPRASPSCPSTSYAWRSGPRPRRRRNLVEYRRYAQARPAGTDLRLMSTSVGEKTLARPVMFDGLAAKRDAGRQRLEGLSRRRLKCGVFHSVADPKAIIAAAKRGHQTLQTIH
jgi:hypothetical protein